jgi:RNA polymerase sigma-70 factor (ECF subfamily)
MDYRGDTYYIKQVLAGKSEAYSHIVLRHTDNAFNLAFRICGRREDAEEVTQDSFVKAYRALGEFKMKSSFPTWLYRIVYNTSVSFLRSVKHEILSLEDFPAEAADFLSSGTPEEESETEYRKTLLNFAMQKLPPEDRAIVTLFYFEELPVEEISEITAISKSAVKTKLFRSRKKMAETIIKCESVKTV